MQSGNWCEKGQGIFADIVILLKNPARISLRLTIFCRDLLNGSDDLNNLTLACQRCNGYRYNFTSGVDPMTQAVGPKLNVSSTLENSWW
jgi:hypothetical protein